MPDFQNLVGWGMTCSINGEYSADIAIADANDEYTLDLEWTPVRCTLQSSAPSALASGLSASDLQGSKEHINGVIESISKGEGIIEKNTVLKVSSFVSRLSRKGVMTHSDENAQDTLEDLALNEAGAPAAIFDFSAVTTATTYSGIIKGDNILTEMRKLAQAAYCYLFVNEEGKLIIEPWKDGLSSVDYVIPTACLFAAGRDIARIPESSLVTVRGAYICEREPPTERTASNSGMVNVGISKGGVTRTVTSGAEWGKPKKGGYSIGGGYQNASRGGTGSGVVPGGSVGGGGGGAVEGLIQFGGVGLTPGQSDIAPTSGGYNFVKENASRTDVVLPGVEQATDAFDITATSGQGIDGRDINVSFVAGGGVSVLVMGPHIKVTFSTGVTAVSAIISAINGNAAAAKLVSVALVTDADGAGLPTGSTGRLYLDDGEGFEAGESREYTEEFSSFGDCPEFTLPPPSREKDAWVKSELESHAIRDFVSGNKNIPTFSGGGQRAGNDNKDYQASEDDPSRIELTYGDCSQMTMMGQTRQEVDNEYLFSAAQCDAVANRVMNEHEMNRQRYKVALVYNPNVGLNKVVQFTMPKTGEIIRGPVCELSINYDAAPSATMSIVVQNVLTLPENGPSGNLLDQPFLEYVGGTIWKTTWSNASKSDYTATTIALVAGSPATLTDSASGFVTAGFIADQTVYVSGASDDSNNATFIIAGVAAGTLTLRAHDTLVSQSAGASINIVNKTPARPEFNYVRFKGQSAVIELPASVTRSFEQTVLTISGRAYKLTFSANRPSGSANLVVTTGASTTNVTASAEEVEITFTASSASTLLKWTSTGVVRWEVSSLKLIRTN